MIRSTTDRKAEARRVAPWRVPFLASGALVALGFFVRLRVAESPIFEEVRRAHSTRRTPVVDVLRSEARTVFLAAGSYLSISATGYLVIVYFVSYATSNLRFSVPTENVVRGFWGAECTPFALN